MTYKRNKNERRSSDFDGSSFLLLPHAVLNSPAYLRLTHTAKCLLIDIAAQKGAYNNGRLLASMAHLRERGWNSADVIYRAKRQLLDAGFIHETVKGHRPNKASWYAVTWSPLDKMPGYDTGVERTFIRGAYSKDIQLNPKPTREELYDKWKDSGKSAHSLVRTTEQRPPQLHRLTTKQMHS